LIYYWAGVQLSHPHAFTLPPNQIIKTDSPIQAYSVTKAAQIHLIKSLASIVSPRVRVNSVSPGILMTVHPPVTYTSPIAYKPPTDISLLGMGSEIPTRASIRCAVQVKVRTLCNCRSELLIHFLHQDFNTFIFISLFDKVTLSGSELRMIIVAQC